MLENNEALEGRVFGFGLNAVSGPRLQRLFEKSPEAKEFPGLAEISVLLKAEPPRLGLNAEGFDALIALYGVLDAAPSVPNEITEPIFDLLVSKLKAKGGKLVPYGQVVDAVYEISVALRLCERVPGAKLLKEDHLGSPDLVYEVSFAFPERTNRIALECKNIRHAKLKTADLVRSVSKAIEEATSQHKKRSQKYDDLLIFVDLPVQILSFSGQAYAALIYTVREDLETRLSDVDETSVIFTCLSQANALEVLVAGSLPNSLVLLPPVVTKESSVFPPRAVFLSYLYSKDGVPNIANFGNASLLYDPSVEIEMQT